MKIKSLITESDEPKFEVEYGLSDAELFSQAVDVIQFLQRKLKPKFDNTVFIKETIKALEKRAVKVKK